MRPDPLLLALHSSSDTLAVGVQQLASAGVPLEAPRLASFPLGRALSNELLPCVEQLLPAEQWPQLGRLVVATGPGGFTGTRLTLVLARTLAQQLAIPLHGFSSFLLMARRLAGEDPGLGRVERFWLTQTLPRRGTVAGAYRQDPQAFAGVTELVLPRLFRGDEAWAASAERSLPAAVEPEADALQLLALGQLAAASAQLGPWQPVLPIYPTSPVEGP